jgi:glycine cleavage system regulatory protein
MTVLIIPLIATGCTIGMEPVPLPANGAERTITRTFDAEQEMVVELENLAGRIILAGASSADQIGVEAVVKARADSEQEADRLADSLELIFDESHRRLVVTAVYPVDDHQVYLYPGEEVVEGFAHLFGSSKSKMRYQDTRVTVVNRPTSDAVMLYADITLTLPAGVSAEIGHGVGRIAAEDVEGGLVLSSKSGKIEVSSGVGDLELGTLSGDILVREHVGNVGADTGSGDIDILGVAGDVWADTGSGDVTVRDMEGDSLTAETGSGDIDLEGVNGSVMADTGSGDVSGSEMFLGAHLVCDTGSGDVDMSGDLSRVEELALSTGSGDIDLELFATIPAIHLYIRTSTGRIDVDLPGMEIVQSDRRHMEARVGAASAKAKIETGSGSVRISARD